MLYVAISLLMFALSFLIEEILNSRLTVLPGLAVDGHVISMGYGGRRRIERALREWSEGQIP